MTLWRLLTTLTALGTAACGGAFWTWSTFTATAIGRLPAAQGMAAMQQVNLAAPRSAGFMGLLLVPAVLAAAVGVHAVVGRSDGGWLVVAGAAVYLVGVVGTTVAFHVPRNDALAVMDPLTQADLFRPWLDTWVAGNHVRTASGLVSGLLLALSLR